MKRVVFITGTDTGVGKTVVTALLLRRLRQNKVNALAMKPFCSGDRTDVDLIQSFQCGELTDTAVNPYFYREPLAPFATASRGKRPQLRNILARIEVVKQKADVLLIEGAGGVLVPINQGLCIADIIGALKCDVILVARNQLGTLNHTLLSVSALKKYGAGNIKIILMDSVEKDFSSRSNVRVLRALLPGIDVLRLPFSSEKFNKHGVFDNYSKKNNKTLARMLVHP